MKLQTAYVGARGVDSLQFSNSGSVPQANLLKASGVDFFVGYLGAVNAGRLAAVIAAGLAFMPVTFAGEYKDGAADEIAQLKALGLPAGVSVWLDLEGLDAWNMGKTAEGRANLSRLINAWAKDIAAAGYMPCLYVGAPQPLTGADLYALAVVRYWLGIGRCVDYTGKDAYPACGWSMRQDWHNEGVRGVNWRGTGIHVDTNSIQCDHRGRLPAWVIAD